MNGLWFQIDRRGPTYLGARRLFAAFDQPSDKPDQRPFERPKRVNPGFMVRRWEFLKMERIPFCLVFGCAIFGAGTPFWCFSKKINKDEPPIQRETISKDRFLRNTHKGVSQHT